MPGRDELGIVVLDHSSICLRILMGRTLVFGSLTDVFRNQERFDGLQTRLI